MRTVLIGVAVVAAIFALIVGGIYANTYIIGGAKRDTADYRGGTDANEKLKADGDYRISVYNSFFDDCASIQTDEARIKALQQELESGVTPGREEQIKASITALRGSRAEKINNYNQNSAKDFTQASFKDLDLPYRLDANDEETQCAA